LDKRAKIHEAELAKNPDIRVHRISKNHAQILALVDALGEDGLKIFPEDIINAAREKVRAMAVERQHAVSADHPIVQEFWEAYDYIEGMSATPALNHYGVDGNRIAVN